MATVTVTSSPTTLDTGSATTRLIVDNRGPAPVTLSNGTTVPVFQARQVAITAGTPLTATAPVNTVVNVDGQPAVALDADSSGHKDSSVTYSDLAPNARSGLASSPEMTATYARRWTKLDVPKPGRAVFPISSDPPIVTVSSHNGGTAISSAVDIVVTGTQPMVAIWDAPARTLVSSTYINNILYDEQNPWSLNFITDAQYFEVSYQASASPAYRLWVDGRRVNADLTNLTNGGGGVYRMKVQFNDKRVRQIRVESVSMFVSKLTVGPTDTVYAPPRPATLAAFIGDSYTQGGGAPDNWAGYCARILGWDYLITGSGGTGYIATSGSHLGFASRLQSTVLDAAPDVVVFAGGINDPLSGLQAAATSLFATTRAALPNALLVAVGPWAPSTTSAGSQATKGTAIAAAVAATSGMIYVDNLTDPWIVGTGKTTALSGSGNADIYIGSDGTHPVNQGSAYLGTRVAEGIYAALPAR